ncbi:MAG: DUF5711 family protein [Roseburia sp.]
MRNRWDRWRPLRQKALPVRDTGNSDSAATSAAEVSKDSQHDSSFDPICHVRRQCDQAYKDGASYIDASGKTIWTQSYEMKTPIININGDYAVIAISREMRCTSRSKEGCTGTAKTQLPDHESGGIGPRCCGGSC